MEILYFKPFIKSKTLARLAREKIKN